MTDITIPPEVANAVARSMCDWDGFDCDEVQTTPDGTTYVMWESYIPKARAACLAMLRAWPGMLLKLDGRYALLPLPKENTNDKG